MNSPKPKSNLKPKSSYAPNDKNNGSEGMVIMATNYFRVDEGEFKVQPKHVEDTLRIMKSHYSDVSYNAEKGTIKFKRG